jgi:hypothetical protein
MPRICTVCTHADRAAIDKAVAAGQPMRALSALYRVSEDAVARHSASHLPARLVKAQERQDVREALDVVAQLKAINVATLEVLRDARASGDGELVLKATDRALKQIELQAKLLGDLDDRPQVNILISAEWAEIRLLILRALGPYPDARTAVAEVLSERAG